MDIIPVDSRNFETVAKQYHLDSEGGVKSVCFEDCLQEEPRIEDVEDNETEYVIFSDSECENEDEDRLKALYDKMANCNLGELMAKNGEGDVEEVVEPSRKLMKMDETAQVGT